MGKDKLSACKRKRDLGRTPDLKGKSKRTKKRRIYVIQKHDASRLHYDLRLEINGVLKSWAVPKGPSTDPSEKRLAVETEDHPLGYEDFEGVIPENEYGAGTVMVWDIGGYENTKQRNGGQKAMTKCYDDGEIEVKLNGKKLKGGYVLKRFRRGKKPQWLLIKMRDADADARRNPVSSQPKSALSNRTLKQIAKDYDGN
jgi:DNA ligase D-like protein (predicted 3'-phosphoesterase)